MTTKAQELGRHAEHSETLDRAVRVGLVGYGAMHLLVAFLAARLALGGQSNPSAHSALGMLAQSTAGRIVLFVVAVGFAALALWQAAEAVRGHRSSEGAKQLVKRGASGVKTVVFAVLAASAFKEALAGGSGSSNTDSMTAQLLSMPAGPVVVALIGVGVLVGAVSLGYLGVSGRFARKLTPGGRQGPDGTAITWAGRIGYVGKGVALGIVGALFVWAGWTHDPHKSGGLDQALHAVLREPFGRGIVVVIAVGIASFGVFCFGWARNLDT